MSSCYRVYAELFITLAAICTILCQSSACQRLRCGGGQGQSRFLIRLRTFHISTFSFLTHTHSAESHNSYSLWMPYLHCQRDENSRLFRGTDKRLNTPKEKDRDVLCHSETWNVILNTHLHPDLLFCWIVSSFCCFSGNLRTRLSERCLDFKGFLMMFDSRGQNEQDRERMHF